VGRRAIPRKLKRQIRQEAGFGCCVCGGPVYEYHHLEEWNKAKQHRAEDLMLLCPNHHDMATKRALSSAEQRAAKTDPFNIREGYAKGQLQLQQNYVALQVGTAIFLGDHTVIAVDGDPLISMRPDETDGVMRLSAQFYDEGGRLLAKIGDNEWSSREPLPWDIEFDYRRLTLRQKARDVRIDLNAKSNPMTLLGELWHKGNRIELKKSGVVINEVKDHGSTLHLSGEGGHIQNAVLLNMDLDIRSMSTGQMTLKGGGPPTTIFSGEPLNERFAEAVAAYEEQRR
jgi:hypothetical protein